jgi:hypothetical protein
MTTPKHAAARLRSLQDLREVPLSSALSRTRRLSCPSASWTCLRGGRQREVRKGKAAEKKEFSAAHVGDTTPDNVSPTKAKTPVGYFEDAQIRTEDKCRYRTHFGYATSLGQPRT